MQRIAIGLAAAGAAAALSSAPSAGADQYDFISQLDNAGVSYVSISGMIDGGKAVCHDLRMGYSIDEILSWIVANNFAPYEAGIIMHAAANNMCPDTMPRVLDWAEQYAPAPPAPALLPAI
jgi:hypothetical protein